MRIKEILKNNFVDEHNIKDTDGKITFITDDSRKVSKGALFIVKNGLHTSGFEFVQEAYKKGAVAIVSESSFSDFPYIKVSSLDGFEEFLLKKFFNLDFNKMKLVGITGTKGKTTTAFFIYEYLLKKGKSVGYIGTVGIYDKDGKHKRNFYTTPNLYELYPILSEFYNQDYEYCVMEVSSHALSQKRVKGLKFAVSVFTNLSHDHLDYHKTIENYFNEKKKLFAIYTKGVSVINLDDPYGEKLYKSLENKIGFSKNRGDYLFAEEEKGEVYTARGNMFDVDVKMPGEYNLYNGVAAALVLYKLGFESKNYSFGENGVPGRLEKIDAGEFTVYVDYAHSPDSLEKVLLLLNKYKKNRIISVFGCTGDRDREKRPIMGAIAERLSDFIILTSDDPHSEDPMQICKEIESGISKKDIYEIETDRALAIKKALNKANNGDIILLAGLGHQRYQIFDGYEIPFNDKDTVLSFLKKKK